MKIARFISFGSICCVGLAVVCEIPYGLLVLCDIYPDELLFTIHGLFIAGLALGVVAVPAILITRTCWWGLIPAMASIFIGGTVVWVNFQIAMHVQRRQETLKTEVGFYNLRVLGEELIKYAETHSGYLPSAKRWCDLLLDNNVELTQANFKHPKAEYLGLMGDCQFAFNSNLSEKKLSDIPDDVILVFEADGAWNLNGTSELLKTRYDKDGYVAIYYPNGKVRNYWFYERSVRKFDGESMYYEEPSWSP